MDFELWILIPSLCRSIMVDEINESSKKLCFILDENYYDNQFSGMTGSI